MSALVRYIIWFVSDAIGMGARGRGPGFGSDIHLVPTSHPKPRDLRSTDEELTGSRYRWTRADAVVSQFPLEERSSDVYEKANAESGTAVPNVIPFPISHRKVEVDDVKESQKQHGGTAKIRFLFYWSLVGWLLFNL